MENALRERVVVMLSGPELGRIDATRGERSRSQFIRSQLGSVGIVYTETKPLNGNDVNSEVKALNGMSVSKTDSHLSQ